ncbi:MAG TPA: hypothetical protein VFS62_03830 [Chloroflexota bacterium]|jgi:hypothetical protein|nr:hypothetical protein [Chloroflexota bacterium]
MVSSVTTSTTATMFSLSSNPALAGLLGLIVVATFVGLLITRQMVDASTTTQWVRTLRRGANIAIYPLGMAFLLVVAVQMAQTVAGG